MDLEGVQVHRFLKERRGDIRQKLKCIYITRNVENDEYKISKLGIGGYNKNYTFT